MKNNRIFWFVAVIGLVLDRITKELIVQNFSENQTLPIISGIFHFTYVVNTGAAFSFFRDGVNWLRWLSLIVSLGLIIFALITPRIKTIEQLGYGFILAGALGNGIDRFLLGYVVDFLDFRVIDFPVFNIADVCINFGIVFLLIASFPSLKTSDKRRK